MGIPIHMLFLVLVLYKINVVDMTDMGDFFQIFVISQLKF